MLDSLFVIPRPCEIPKGAYGIWQIPEFDIAMPLYQRNGKSIQQVIDDEHSALIMPFGAGSIILDHADSEGEDRGYWQIGMVHPDTLACLIRLDGTLKYQCSSVYRVICNGSGYMHEGKFLQPKLTTDIFCNCCATKDAKENYLAWFKYKGKME